MEQQFITFEGKELLLQWGSYPTTNQKSLQLLSFDPVNKGGFEPFMTVTEEIEHVEFAEDEIVVKNYSKNEGILSALVKADIIAKPHETVKSGYVELHICQLIN